MMINNKMKHLIMRKLGASLMLTLFGLLGLIPTLLGSRPDYLKTSHAEETTDEKVEAEAGEAKKDIKASGRNAKKKMRSSKSEDTKDSMQNAGDEVKQDSKKLKNKID